MSATPSPDYFRPSAREVLFGRVFGSEPAEARPRPAIAPRAALDELVLAALREPPCFVAFSGGRDSSAILAVATAVARRHGLPLPVPITEVYPLAPGSDESDWQQLVVDGLGLDDWLRVEFGYENDLVGPTARDGLVRLGLLWPATAQIKPNVFRHVAGGALLTGEGGDEAFSGWRIAALSRLLRGRDRPSRSSLRSAAKVLAPRWLRRRHGMSLPEAAQLLPWLRPDALAEYVRLARADAADEPLRWADSLWSLRGIRAVTGGYRNYELLAADAGVRLLQPFAHPDFLAALAGAGGTLGYSSRTDMMGMLFSDVLPAAMIERRTKAWFNEAHFGEPTRAFARGWNGTGLDAAAVDTEVLRAEWLSDSPSALTGLALQAAWLAQHSAGHPDQGSVRCRS